MKHENGVDRCPRCEEKLKEANSTLIAFFYWVRTNHPDVHISWSFRDEANQDQCFSAGLSRLRWPNSPHNALNLLGQACSEALDLFRLNGDGKAEWPADYFKAINDETKTAGLPILWGGNFKHLGDLDHFQMT